MANQDIFGNKNNEELFDSSIDGLLDSSQEDTYGLNAGNKTNNPGTDPLAKELEQLQSENLNITYIDNIGDDANNLVSSPLLFNQNNIQNDLFGQELTNFNKTNIDLDKNNIDSLTGNNKNNPLVGTFDSSSNTNLKENSNSNPNLISDSTENTNLSFSRVEENSNSSSPTPMSASVPPKYAIRTEKQIRINNGGDLDGNPLDISDDALIYSAKGFTINGNITLPVQRDANGNPLRDDSGKLILVDNAVTVAPDYNTINANTNQYSNLVPPQVVDEQIIDIPVYENLKQQTLDNVIAPGTQTVTFNSSQNPLNNSQDWDNKFPAPGTPSNPTVVRVTGGGLNIPGNINISNYVIIVENGDINFNGNNHNFENVVLIAENGNINLSQVQATDLSVFASRSINMNNQARYSGSSLLASGSNNGSINFNGTTASTDGTDTLRVVSNGRITFNAASDTRGSFESVGDFTFNNNSTLYGTIAAKGFITFNNGANVVYASDLPDNGGGEEDTQPPIINANLANDTGASSSDGITSDPTISGTVTDDSQIVLLKAGFDGTDVNNYVDITAQLQPDGSFTLNKSALESIKGDILADDSYTLYLQATDSEGNTSDVYELTFTLDSVTPPTSNLGFAIKTESKLTINGGGDLDGEPFDLNDDALIYSAKGFTINGNITLPVQRDENGNPLLDNSGKLILVDNAVTVAPDYNTINANTNQYSNLVPPQVVDEQIINIPDYANLKQQTLDSVIAPGTQTVIFNSSQNSLNNSQDWNNKFPPPGTPSNPTVVRVTGGGLNIPGNINISNYVITVENGDINFNGSNHNFNNVVLISNNGNINLSGVQATNLSVFASRSINMNNQARYSGSNLLASGSNNGSINFNGTTASTDGTDTLRVVSSGRITFNAASDTRGSFESVGDFTFNNNSTLYGTIAAKGNITFNNGANVIYVSDAPTDTDTSSPIIDAALTNDTGVSDTDKITNDPTISGTVIDDGEIVQFSAGFNDSEIDNYVNVLPQRDVNGNFSFDRATLESIYGDILPSGNHTLHLISTDASGNVSNLFDLTFTLDTVTPAPDNLDLTATNDSGVDDSDNITNNSTPEITGNAEVGSKVELLNNSIKIGEATVDGNGDWRITTNNLEDGDYSITAIATDIAGNQNQSNVPLSLTIDTAAPPSPIDLKLSPDSDSGISNSDNITNDENPTITGLAAVGATVELFSDGISVGTTTASGDGNWEITVAENLTDGVREITAVATDVAGNQSVSSTPLSINIDSELPQFNLTTPIDTSALTPESKITGTVNGTGSNIDKVTYRFNDLEEIPVSINSTGTFNQAFDLTGLNNGDYTVTVTTTDVAGNVNTFQYNVTVEIDINSPIIDISLNNDTAANNTTNTDRITSDPTINGTITDNNDIVSFQAGFDDNLVDVTSSLQPDGSFSFDRTQLETILGNNLEDGIQTLQLQATDEFGNQSEIFSFTFTLDTTVNPPDNLNLPADKDSGVDSSDNITNDNSPIITGDAEPNSTVQLSQNGEVVGETTATEGGNWEFTINNNLDNGDFEYSAIATDIAGNTSSPSTPLTITIDTVLPSINLTTATDTPIVLGDKLTGIADGTGSSLENLTYRFDDGEEIALTIDSQGNFDAYFDLTDLENGSHILNITSTDTAGNINTIQYNVTINIDDVAPIIAAGLFRDTAPNNQTNTDNITFDATISGTVTEENQIVELKAAFDNTPIASGTDVTAQLQPDGNFTFNQTTLETIYGDSLPDGTHTLSLQAKDEYGNISDNFDITFTLDTNIVQPVFDLDSESDSDEQGDKKTTFEIVTLTGQTESNAEISLQGTDLTTTADSEGNYSFADISVYLGDNSFTAVSVDIAGNQNTYTEIITRLNPPAGITLDTNTIPENSNQGTVIGILGSTDTNTENTFTYSLIDDSQGRFQIVENSLQVADGTLLDFETTTQHTITVRSIDNNGVVATEEFSIDITNVNEAPLFNSTPEYTGETGSEYTYNITTTDPDAGDTRTISSSNLPEWLTLTDNGDGSATLIGTPTNTTDGIPTEDSLYNVDLTVTDAGGLTEIQSFIISAAPNISLTEETNFTQTQNISFTIPQNPSILKFKINPQFDTTDAEFINDAFEVALIDVDGKSLVHTFSKDKDAFFNLTEGENAALGAGTNYNSADGTISLNLTGVPPETDAKLIFRLVNNDSDTTTNVTISDFTVEIAPQETQIPTQNQFDIELNPGETPDFNLLTDVSDSFSAEYKRTTYNADTKLLYADIAIRNNGSYSIDAPLIVAVTNISDPSVILRNPEGLTPDGIPYYNFSNLVENEKLNPEELTSNSSLVFYNPEGGQFTYNLQVLAEINAAPVIESKPEIEILGGKQYQYQIEATDPNDDTITYELLTSPEGMSIDAETGLITWDTTTDNVGNQNVVVQASDSRGRTDTQVFNLAVIDTPPNRPPVFTSTPVVDAAINTEYKYDVNAKDPDLDEVNYSLGLAPEGMEIDAATGEITWTPKAQNVFGDTVLGRITNPGERDVYTFGAVEGERIYYDSLIGNDYQSLKLFSPSGISLLRTDRDKNTKHQGLIHLSETGNYRLEIQGSNRGVGDYGFSLVNLDEAPIAPFDEDITGVLNPGIEDDVYRFYGNKGQRLYFDSLSSSNLSWTIYGADNQNIKSNSSFNDIEIELPADGAYTLILTGKGNLNNTVPYGFRIVTADTNIQEIELGSNNNTPNIISNTIAEKGEQDVYTFDGSNGQRLYLDILSSENSNISFAMYSPSGDRVFNSVNNKLLDDYFNNNDKGPFTLREDGTYRLVIDGSRENTGNYNFSLRDIDKVDDLILDKEQPGTILNTNGRETHLYKFAGTEGQRLYLDSLQNAGAGKWRVYSAGNRNIIETDLYRDVEITLPSTDTYILALQSNQDTPAEYKFQVVTPEIEIGETITHGDIITGEITEKGEEDIYTFAGSIGERVFLDALLETIDIEAKLVSPSGIDVFYRDINGDQWYSPQILPEDGTYQLTINGEGEKTGEYKFRLLSFDNAVELTSSISQPGTLNSGSEIDLYKFTGSKGERVYFNSLVDSSDSTWLLYGPDNQKIGESSLNNDFEKVLSGDGTYYLMLRGNGSETTIDYEIEIISSTSPEQLLTSTNGDIFVDSDISKLGEQDTYTFSGEIGQQLYFDGILGNDNIKVKLESPSGSGIFSGRTNSDSTPITLVEAGIYRLTVDGDNDTTGNYNFRIANIEEQDILSFDVPETPLSGSLNQGETKLYQIDGKKGQKLNFETLNTESNGEWILYAPGTLQSGNNRVANNNLNSDFTNILPSDGIYTLAIRNTSDNTISYDAKVNDITSEEVATSGLGVLIEGDISTVGEVDEYTFIANAGTLIYFDGQGDDNSRRVRLYNPDDTLIFNNASNDSNYGPYLLQQTGTYKLEAYGYYNDTIGDYKFQLLDLENAPILDLNISTDISLGAKETKAYKFNGEAGQKVWLDGLSDSNPEIKAYLYNPNGRQLYDYSDFTLDKELQTFSQDGSYYLIFSSDKTSETTASFQLLDNKNAQAISLTGDDVNISGNFGTSGRETNIYKFNGNKGQLIYFQRNDGFYNNYYDLYNPAGEIIFSRGLSNDYEVKELPSDGEYILVLKGYARSNNNYDLTLFTPELKSFSYTIGDTINDNIVKPGENHTYTFSGKLGQKLYFDALNTIDPDFTVRLFAPSGKEVYTGEVQNDRGTETQRGWNAIYPGLVLKEAGTYRLVVDGDSNKTGNYSFRLFDTAKATSIDVASDAYISGNLGTDGREAHIYKFNGSQGQRLYFESDNGHYTNRYSLFNPAGESIFYNRSVGYDIEPQELPSDGEYTLVVRGNGNPDNNYGLRILTSEITTASYTLGEEQKGIISEAGEQDIYTFTGKVGQQIYFDGLNNNDPKFTMRLIAPSGKELYRGEVENDRGTETIDDPYSTYYYPGLVLEEAGTYQIVIDGYENNIGDYSFRFLDLALATNIDLDTDNEISGNLGEFVTEAHAYKFSAKKGQRLYFQSNDGEFNNIYSLYKPNGEVEFWKYLNNDKEEPELDSDGEYTLIIKGNGTSNSTYNLKIVAPDLVTESLTLGTTINSEIDKFGEEDTYTFAGVAGQRLFFDTILTNGQIQVSLYSPSGKEVFSGRASTDSNAPFVIRETGEYRLVIDGLNDIVGNYSFRLSDVEDIDQTAILQFNNPVTASIDSANKSRFYQFNASAGESFYLDLLSDNRSDFNWFVYDPGNKNIAQSRSSTEADLEIQTEVTGTYILRIDNETDSSIEYNFNLTKISKNEFDLELSTVITGSISNPGEQNEYTFSGEVGQRLLFDGISSSDSANVKLFSPTGVEVAKKDADYDWDKPLTLTEDGTYRLVVDADYDTTSNYEFNLLDISKAPVLETSKSYNGTVNPNEIKLYQFNGTVGQQLNFDLPENWSGAYWQLYAPNNDKIIYDTRSDGNKLLSASGLYTFAIKNNGSTTANYDFDFTVTDAPTAQFTGLSGIQSGTIDAGEVSEYTFTASAGTRVLFDSQIINSEPLKAVLVNPDGTQYFSQNASSDSSIRVLEQTGEYTLKIQGSNDISTGNYQFRLVDLPSIMPDIRGDGRRIIQYNAEITKPLEGREVHEYSFEGKVGERLFYDGLYIDGASSRSESVDARLISPSGKVIFDLDANNLDSTSDNAPFTLTESGTYHLLLEGEQDTPTGYRFNLWNLADAYELEFNKQIRDNLIRGNDTKLYKFDGNKGQRISLEGIEGNEVDWRLYRPGNQKYLTGGSINSSNYSEIELKVDGEYVLAISGTSNIPTQYGFQVYDLDEEVAIVTPGEGESGQTIDNKGSYRVLLEAKDNRGGKAVQDFKIKVAPEVDNNAPIIVSEAVTTGFADIRYIYDVNANDADDDTLTYRLVNSPRSMYINEENGIITWETPITGSHEVTVRVEDKRGGVDTQTFEISISDADPGTVKGSIYADIDADGKRRLTNPNNLTPDEKVIVGEAFRDIYAAYDLGTPAGVPAMLGGMTFKKLENGEFDPYTMLIGGAANNCGGVIMELQVQRGDGGHIIGFDDDDNPDTPYVANFYGYSPYIDAGLVHYTDLNELLRSSVKGSMRGLSFVPDDLPGAGALKSTGANATFSTVNYDAEGNITSTDIETIVGDAGDRLGSFVYMDVNSPGFSEGASLLMAEWSKNQINAYEIDAEGNPVTSDKRLFIDNYEGASGAVVDPVTGDLLFNAMGGDNNVMVVRGLGEPGDNEPGLANWLVFADSNADGIRDKEEQFTYTDEDGNYSLTLAPGDYRIVQEEQPGWTQTEPVNPNYHEITIASNDRLFGRDFGNTNSKLAQENVDPEFTSNPLSAVTEGAVPPLTENPVVEVTAGEKFIYRSTATDLNADDLTFDLVVKPEGMAISDNGIISWRPSNDQVEKHQVITRVSDGRGGVDLQPFEINVNLSNRNPIFTSIVPDIARPTAEKQYQFQTTATDLDEDTITYEIITSSEDILTPNGVEINSETGLITWTPTAATVGGAIASEYVGDSITPWQVLVKASDGKGGEGFQKLNLIVEPIPPVTQDNLAPEITSTPRSNVRLGNTYLYQIEANDVDGDALTYSLDSAPEGMILDNGVVSWVPNANQFGNQEVTVRVSDGELATIQSFNINVTNQSINNAPTITSVPELITNIEKEYTYNVTGTDADGDYLVWSLDNAPNGMVINPETGALRWNPTEEQIGEHNISVTLTDANGAFVGQEFTLYVNGTNTPPQIVSTAVTRAAVNQDYKYQIVATDPENDTLTYSLGNSPAGMTVSENGLITWTPEENQLQDVNVSVFVTDAQGATSSQSFTIEIATEEIEVVVDGEVTVEVVPVAINNAPEIISNPVYLADTNSTYEYQVVANDPDAGDTLTYQLLSVPNNVTGMSINATTGLLTWNNPVAGTYQIAVGAVDNQGLGAAQGFTLTARANNAPVINSTPGNIVNAGSIYAYDVRAVDVDGDVLNYTLDQASLDKGITIDELGRLRWKTTLTDTNHSATVTVADGNGGSTQQEVEINVVGDTEAPQVRLTAGFNFINQGESVTFQARATDNIGVAGLQLLINDNPVVIDGNGLFTVENAPVGTLRGVAIATDAALNTNQATFDVDVVDTSDVNAPTVSFSLDVAEDGIVTAPTDIIGTISDDGDIDYYTVEVAPVAGGEFKEILRVDDPDAVTDGVLGKFDPSLLQNDSYRVRLSVYDDGGNGTFAEEVVDVAGELKLGNFRLSFTDLEVPVTGIPITLTRTYDTLTSSTTDDFGYGWRMEFRDTDLRTSLGKPTEEDELLGRKPAYKDDTRVYITLPGGKREGFTFKPSIDPISGFLRGAAAGTNADTNIYRPAFEADDGVTSTLTVKDERIIRNNGTSEFFGISGSGYNPADSLFGGTYILTTKEGIEYEIDGVSGDLLKVTDTNGNTLTYTDEAVTSSTGQKITFERDAEGRITSVKDPEGELIRYEYDDNGDLVSVTDREENVTRMEYNPEREHYLDKIIDPLGRTGARNEYGEDGRLKKVFDANGNAVELDYNPENSIQTVKDILGYETTYIYDERGNVLTEIDAEGKITEREYDDDNNVEVETIISDRSGSEGFTTKYTYDSQGNKLTEEDPLGNITRYTYGDKSRLLKQTDALGRTTTNTYDGNGNLKTTEDADGNVTISSYDLRGQLRSVTDANNKVTKFDYDAQGNIKSITDANNKVTGYTYNANGNRETETRWMTLLDGTKRKLVTTTEYDNEGRLKTIIDTENNTTTYEYDKLGYKIAEIDALNRRTEYVYNDKGELIETIHPDDTPDTKLDNPRTKTKYDKAGRQIETIDQLNRTTKYRYDKVGRLVETILPDLTPETDEDNPRTKTEYYTDGLVKAQIDERENRTEFRYDAAGRLIKTIYADDTLDTLDDNPSKTYKYDKAGQRVAETDALNHTTTFEYDDLGRLEKTEFHDKTYTKQEYDNLGRRTAMIDQEGKRTEYSYDDLGRLTGVQNALDDWTTYDYNEVGNLISITDAEEHTTRYEYDGVGRRTTTILPMNRRSEMTYDAVGNLKTYTDFNQRIITYDYDPQNRMNFKLFEDGSKVTYDYTLNNLQDVITFVDAQGNITATYDYDYDERDRQVKRTDTIDGVSRNISYTYDAASNRTSVTTGSGTVNYTFDERNRLDQIIENGITTADYDYDAVSNLIRTTFGNGTEEVRRYDDLNRLEYLEDRQGNTVLSSYDYTLDKAGNRTKVVEHNGRTVEYTYDDLYRLLKEEITDTVNGNQLYSYDYDKVGNRKTKTEIIDGITTVTAYEYDDNDRLLNEKVDGNVVVNYTYDDQGNTLTKSENGITTNYTWDDENRLIAATIEDALGVTQQQMQYQYNDNGIRVSSAVDGDETRYLVDEVQQFAQVLEEYKPDSTVLVEYVYGHDLIAQEQIDTRTYYHIDGLGSTRVLTDASGGVVSTYDYDAYGELINSTGVVENKYLFAGEQFDEALGDYYNRARYYDAATGRFTRKDDYEGRLGEPLTLHKYIYAHDNPISFTDPLGLFSLSLHAQIAIASIISTSYVAIWGYDHWIRKNSGKKQFETSDEAAIAVLKMINPVSKKENREHAGRICQDLRTKKFFYTEPYPGGESSARPGFCPALSIPQGYYHTHGSGPKDFNPFHYSELVSDGDYDVAQTLWFEKVGYVATPSGIVKRFTPEQRNSAARGEDDGIVIYRKAF
ncbi:MAG: Ig-like domain-containing protein [Cyanobacteria bacterium P01_D01_bin.116]